MTLAKISFFWNEFNSQFLSNSDAIRLRIGGLAWSILLPATSEVSDNHTISVMPVRNVELWVWVVSRDVRISLGCDFSESLKSVSSGKRTQQNSRYRFLYSWSLCPWSASRKIVLLYALQLSPTVLNYDKPYTRISILYPRREIYKSWTGQK